MTTTIYRVQNRFGEGPYRGSSYPRLPNYEPSRHPTPDVDWAALSMKQDVWGPLPGEWEAYRALVEPYSFGFPTREAAVEWFGEDGLQMLLRQGFMLVEVQAVDVTVSDSGRQCMFIPAAPLSTYSTLIDDEVERTRNFDLFAARVTNGDVLVAQVFTPPKTTWTYRVTAWEDATTGYDIGYIDGMGYVDYKECPS